MSSPVEEHVLARIAAAPVLRSPFEHSIIDGIFPEEFLGQIHANWPGESEFAPLEESGRVVSAPERYGKRRVVFLSDEGTRRLDAARRDFWMEHFWSWLSSKAMIEAIVDKYRPLLRDRLEGASPVIADGLIVSDRTRYAIGPHTDGPRRLVSLLFYLPADDSLSSFGTSFYEPRDKGFVCDGGPHYDFEGFRRVQTVEFVPNRLVMFPKTDRCFHGVEEISRPDVDRRLVIFDLQVVVQGAGTGRGCARAERAAGPPTEEIADAKLSRAEPSERHRELMSLYARLHSEGEAFLGIPAKETFPGLSLTPHVKAIRALIEETGSQTILDYGCGKGLQYLPRRIVFKDEPGEWESVADYWNVDNVACYDPCVPAFSKLPDGGFDGVISTDVLEHCAESDVPWIIEEMFSRARAFVFLTIAGYPARKRLPNGENAHCTIRPLEWWSRIVSSAAARHAGVRWRLRYYERSGKAGEFVELSGGATP